MKNHPKRSVLITLCLSVGLLAIYSLVIPSFAYATYGCLRYGSAIEVTPADDSDFNASVTLSRSGDVIEVSTDTGTCSAAFSAISEITIAGDDFEWIRVTIDLSGGPLAPGPKISINGYQPGYGSHIDVIGSPGPDVWRIGSRTMHLNYETDQDPDIMFPDYPSDVETYDANFNLFGEGGNDDISARGINGIDAPLDEAHSIYGGPGDDTLVGGLGAGFYFDDTNVLLVGDAGNDDLHAGLGSGPRLLFGGDGNDLLTGTGYGDVLYGGSGNDDLLGFAGPDRLTGGSGSDHLTGGRGHDRLSAGSGSDRLLGGKGHDDLRGELGRDRFLAKDGCKDRVRGGPNHDLASVDHHDALRSIEGRV